MKFIKNTPAAITGVSLAFAALGNLLLPYGEGLRFICGIISATLLLIFLVKLICYFDNIKEEVNNPIALGTLPTSTMALMLLCTYVKPFLGTLAVILWYCAIAFHIFIMVLFIKRFVIGFKLQNVFPSYFVAGVGIVAASVTSRAMGALLLGRAIFYFGLVVYLILLAVVIWRMAKLKGLPEPARPVIAIFIAPPSLCIVGYMSAFGQPGPNMVYFLLALAILSYIYVTINMFFLLRLKFYPTYSAFTFPYVISAIAFKSANATLINNGAHFFSFVPRVSEFLAIAIVLYVSIRYIIFLAHRKEA